uniref:Uncharacterized protein n=1 Tax=Arundo donax TaxID=35708 RepID=A0A0A9G1Q5_ARUDO
MEWDPLDFTETRHSGGPRKCHTGVGLYRRRAEEAGEEPPPAKKGEGGVLWWRTREVKGCTTSTCLHIILTSKLSQPLWLFSWTNENDI